MLIDETTGEKYGTYISPITRMRGKFVKQWQSERWWGKIKKLQGNSLRVLWYLGNITDYGNEVPGPTYLSQELGWKQQQMSRAYLELIAEEFLIKRDGVYMLNPYFCWKGNDEQYEEACRRMGAGRMKEIVA